MKCEIPLATLYDKFKEVTSFDCTIDAVRIFNTKVFLPLMKTFPSRSIGDYLKIEASCPVIPLIEALYGKINLEEERKCSFMLHKSNAG